VVFGGIHATLYPERRTSGERTVVRRRRSRVGGCRDCARPGGPAI
jgi:hypothetical protein